MGRKPLARSVPGLPLPEDENVIDLSHRLLSYWPVWDFNDRVEKEGITINRAVLRPGWVKLELDWWRAEGLWKQKLTATLMRDIIAMAGNESTLYFNHWQVLKPKHVEVPMSWSEALNNTAREAIVYFHTHPKRQKSVHDLLQYLKKEEVNSIILANAFSLMEKEGIDDQD